MFIPIHCNFKTYLILFLTVMLAGCATSKNEIVIDTDDIVISEEYGVDKDITEKFNQAVTHMNNKNYKEAVELLVDVTSRTEKHSAPYINLGIAYAKLDKMKEAEKILLKAIKISPNHPVANNELGLVYRKSGRFAEAKQVYEKVVKNYPQFLPARKNLGILCDLFIGDLDCAISHYEAFLKIQPNEKNVQIWLVDLKRRAGQQ